MTTSCASVGLRTEGLLEVTHDGMDLGIRQRPRERGHERARLPVFHDQLELHGRPPAPEIRIAEVPWFRTQRGGCRAVPPARLPVTRRAAFGEHLLAEIRIGAGGGCDERGGDAEPERGPPGAAPPGS